MFRYILLGIVQGITEFLPVSSSGHLVILQRLLGITGEELTLSVVLHLGTALALIVFFFKDIIEAARNVKLLLLIGVVTIITGVIGITGKDFFTALFSSPRLVAVALIVTGLILMRTRRFMHGRRDMLDIKDALVLGLVQGIAIIPGISRSGITISALLSRKIDVATTFRFSFLACIPAILGAMILEAKDISLVGSTEFKNFFIGFLFSFLTGLLSLKILKTILLKAKLYYFGFYCIFVALLTLLFIK